MELYARVRRAVLVEGRSEREVAREFGLARETGAQDAALLDSTGLLAEGVGSAAETGAVAGRDRRHSGRRQEQTSQAAAHGEADLRPPAAGVWLHGRLYDREPHPGQNMRQRMLHEYLRKLLLAPDEFMQLLEDC